MRNVTGDVRDEELEYDYTVRSTYGVDMDII